MKDLCGGLFVWYSMDMKVTSLNLAGYKNWPERESHVISYLEAMNSDVVFLQEVKFNSEYSSYSQSKYLNDKLEAPYPYTQSSVSRYYTQSDGIESREGLAVLSKFPISDSETIVLKKRTDDKHTRIIQKVSLLVDGQTINFTNVHFSNNDYSDEQLEETLKITKSRDETSVILGDFNIFDIQTVRDLYSDDYRVSTDFYQYVTFPSENVTLDYVLVPRDYGFTSLSIGENLSDHNALTFELSVQ
jgi:endonuclease/exonuclease/phosphatase family metal-dependent hydrolase